MVFLILTTHKYWRGLRTGEKSVKQYDQYDRYVIDKSAGTTTLHLRA